MWTASMAINGILSDGAEVSWCVHPMEHELSAFYDITHGEGLAILTPPRPALAPHFVFVFNFFCIK